MQTHTETAILPKIHKIANLTDQPAVYVGTFAKYNSGDLTGAWLDLSAYSDLAEFLEACAALHSDENDPEIMFQDYQGFPTSYFGESWIDAALWDWLNLDEIDREMVTLYRHEVDCEASIEDIKERFYGSYISAEAWAEDWLEATGGLEGVPDHLVNYIDFEAYARDARLGGEVVFVEAGYREVLVFSNH